MSEVTPNVPQVAHERRAPLLIRALGLGALGFGVFLALGMATAIFGAGWMAGSGLMAFGLYWAIWGNSDTGPGAPFPNVLTGAGLPWPVFFVPGIMITVTLSLPQSRTWLRGNRVR